MPLRYSRRTRRPRTMRRRRIVRRRTYRNRRMNRKRSTTHLFKRSFHTTINILKSANTAGCNYFQLDQLPNYSEFVDLFDQYKVNALKYEFVPRFNSIDQASATGGEFYTAIDRVSNDPPSSLNEMLEYQSLRKTPLTRRHVRYFKPGVATAIYANVDDASGSTYPFPAGVKLSPWISTDAEDNTASKSTNIQHLGLKYWCSQTNASANTTMDIICTAFLGMRTVK